MSSALMLSQGAPQAFESSGKSVGITGPTTGQAVVVTKARLDQHVYRRTPNDPRPGYYHKGSLECYDAMPSEIVLAVLDHQQTQFTMIPNDIQMVATTSLNGRSRLSSKLSFRGVVNAAGWVSKATSDFGFTLRSSGTETVINNGPDAIPEGALVIWTYPSLDARDRMKRAGQPEDKVVPELRAWDGQRLSRFLAQFTDQLVEHFDTGRLRSDRDLVAFVKQWDPLAHDGGASDHGVLWAYALLLLNSHITMAEMAASFAENRLLQRPTHPLAAEGLANAALAVAGMSDEVAPEAIAVAFSKAMSHLVGQYCDLMRARIVGKALTSALPGKQLDLLIGFTDLL